MCAKIIFENERIERWGWGEDFAPTTNRLYRLRPLHNNRLYMWYPPPSLKMVSTIFWTLKKISNFSAYIPL